MYSKPGRKKLTEKKHPKKKLDNEEKRVLQLNLLIGSIILAGTSAIHFNGKWYFIHI